MSAWRPHSYRVTMATIGSGSLIYAHTLSAPRSSSGKQTLLNSKREVGNIGGSEADLEFVYINYHVRESSGKRRLRRSWLLSFIQMVFHFWSGQKSGKVFRTGIYRRFQLTVFGTGGNLNYQQCLRDICRARWSNREGIQVNLNFQTKVTRHDG